MIKFQDVVVLAKLIFYRKKKINWSQASLAKELCLSPSQVNYGLKRLVASKLIAPVLREESEIKLEPVIQFCEEFLIHEFKFVFPPEFGSMAGGIPATYAAPPLNEIIISGNDPFPCGPLLMEHIGVLH